MRKTLQQEKQGPILIAHISDFHVVPYGRVLSGSVNSAAMLDGAVKLLKSFKPRPDLVIGTGDLVENGRSEEYTQVRSILAGLNTPFLPVLGNHDNRSTFRTAFADLNIEFGPSQFIQFTYDLGSLQIIVLDTVREGSDDPEFCTERLVWLRESLDAAPTSVLIAMHHSPFAVGMAFLNPSDPSWSNDLANVIRRSGKVKKIICGHVHRGIHRNWAGSSLSTAPSTALQVAMDMTPNASARFSRESPGFNVHHWDGAVWTTYSASIAGFGDYFSLDITTSQAEVSR